MTERYERVFSLKENLYAAGSPVIISAGALLKDHQSGKILAQLKLKSINSLAIKAVTVKIWPEDTLSQPLGEPFDYQYLDLTAQRDSEFGQTVPIVMPDAATRTFRVVVTEVIFSDQTTWKGSPSNKWQPLPALQSCQSALQDLELVRQYFSWYGYQAQYLYQETCDLWYCSCGAINHIDEASCHKCQQSREQLLAFDMEQLRKACAERLEKEAVIAAEKRAVELQKKAKRNKKLKIAAIIGVPLIIIAIIAGNLLQQYEQDSENYDFAQRMMNEENYEGAVRQFQSLGDFKDSPEMLEKARTLYDEQQEQEKQDAYEQALQNLNEGASSAACYGFEELGDYKDSKEKFEEAYFQNNLDVFPNSLDYFQANKSKYALLEPEQIRSIIAGTWILPAQTFQDYYLATFAADGTGEDDASSKCAWKADEQGFHYTFVFDGEEPRFSAEESNEFRQVEEGVYACYDAADPEDVQLFISADSVWGERYIKAFERYVEQ